MSWSPSHVRLKELLSEICSVPSHMLFQCREPPPSASFPKPSGGQVYDLLPPHFCFSFPSGSRSRPRCFQYVLHPDAVHCRCAICFLQGKSGSSSKKVSLLAWTRRGLS